MTTKSYRNRKKMINKNNTHKKKQQGGIGVPGGSMFTKDPVWPLGILFRGGPPRYTTLYTMPERAPNLFGTQIPSTNTFECIQTLAFYMFSKNIKRIVSLQGCPVPYPGAFPVIPPHNCGGTIPGQQGFDFTHEETAWDGLKGLTETTLQDPNITYINCQITDMTAGTAFTWEALSKLDFNDPEQRTLVHCYAGLGRTGSVFLYVMFKHYMNTNNPDMAPLQQNYLGCNTSEGMYNSLRNWFATSIRLDDDPLNGDDINRVIAQFNINKIIVEVFDISTHTKANVFITRINYIIMYTAHQLLENQIITMYSTHPYAGNNAGPGIMGLFIPVQVLLTPQDIIANMHMFGFS